MEAETLSILLKIQKNRITEVTDPSLLIWESLSANIYLFFKYPRGEATEEMEGGSTFLIFFNFLIEYPCQQKSETFFIFQFYSYF